MLDRFVDRFGESPSSYAFVRKDRETGEEWLDPEVTVREANLSIATILECRSKPTATRSEESQVRYKDKIRNV